MKEEEFKGFDYTSDKSTKVQNKLTDSRVLSNGIDFVNVTRLILKALSKNKNDDKSNIKPSEILPYVFDDIFFLQEVQGLILLAFVINIDEHLHVFGMFF